jgi:protein TonB
MSPYENVIVGNSFNEIVFSNRNKEYGAYMLRKKQKRYLISAFAIAFLLVSSSAIVPFIYNQFKGNIPMLNGPHTVIATIDTSLRVIPPEPPAIKVEPLAGRFIAPTVVDTVDNTETNFIFSMDDLIASSGSTDLPTTIETVVTSDPVIEVVERPYISVDVPATFNGGDLNEFNKWVFQNLKYPRIAEENSISGKVTIQFVVNSKGKVENVAVLRGADPALDEEAIRVIKSSPKWTPPFQDGKAVRQLFSLPVNFKIQ